MPKRIFWVHNHGVRLDQVALMKLPDDCYEPVVIWLVSDPEPWKISKPTTMSKEDWKSLVTLFATAWEEYARAEFESFNTIDAGECPDCDDGGYF